MPAMHFHLRWPDGNAMACYSPSLVIKEFVEAGGRYAVPDFVARIRAAYQIANQRVAEKFGFECSQAHAQLDAIEQAAARFAGVAHARLAVTGFSGADPTDAVKPLPALPRHVDVAIVGGGQAGLSLSHYLRELAIDHVVLEKHTVTHTWRSQRWDAFCLVTPNWQCALPGHPYTGDDPHGFMRRDEIIDYLDGFIAKVNAPVHEGVTVERLTPLHDGGFQLQTSSGPLQADQVVVAAGGYHVPILPRLAERLPASITQLQSADYRNPQSLPAGAVLVAGSGQSGAQIAEDLHLAGRKVFLAVGDAPRCARFYRGKDVVDWLAEMRYYDMPVEQHPLREGVRDNTNHYVTGRDGGRDIDLRRFASEGMELFGRLSGCDGQSLLFEPNLTASLDNADAIYNGINASIDRHIEKTGSVAPPGEVYQPAWAPGGERTTLNLAESGITSVIWCIGFAPDFGWVDVPVFNGRGAPVHARGVTRQPGLYFLGLPWLHTWGSGRFSGVARDAQHIAGVVRDNLRHSSAQPCEPLSETHNGSGIDRQTCTDHGRQ